MHVEDFPPLHYIVVHLKVLTVAVCFALLASIESEFDGLNYPAWNSAIQDTHYTV